MAFMVLSYHFYMPENCSGMIFFKEEKTHATGWEWTNENGERKNCNKNARSLLCTKHTRKKREKHETSIYIDALTSGDANDRLRFV